MEVKHVKIYILKPMNKPIQFIQGRQLLKDALGWGFILWLFGYGLGMILFALVPPSMIGWIIMPIATALTLWVLIKIVKGESLKYYLLLAMVWTLIAIVFDYVFLVKVFKPSDGYYKLNVYIYYCLTFILPLIVGWFKKSKLAIK